MSKKLIFLLVLAVALGGANVVLGDVWEGTITNDQDLVEQSNATPTGAMDFGSSDMEFVDDGGIQVVGLRFTNVQVPAGALISNAYVVLTTEEVESNASCNLIIQAHLTPDAPAFTSAPGNLSTRPLTTAVTKWNVEHWAVDNEKHQTADLSAVIAEIVNQPGWAVGNAIVLVFNQDPDLPSQSHRTTHKTGTADYVPLLHIEYTVGLAWGPNPPDGATDVPADASLAWMASKYAATHDVYLGTALADVNNAGQDAAMGVLASQGQSETQYDPAEPLAYGQTYYWRIDEVNAAPDSTVRKGNVWSFTVEPFAYPIANVIATASGSQPDMGPENTVNGSGLNAADQHSTELTDMWTSEGVQPNWIQYEFDKVYKLNELWVWNSNQLIETFLGFGAKDVTLEYSVDGATWSVLEGVPEFAKATAKATYTANTTVDLGGVMARFVKLTIHRNWGGGMPQTGLSEVRFFYVPVQARLPEPADEAAGISIDAELRWRPGREAESHEVYLGTEENALTLADTVTGTSYSPLALDLATTYYWKVSEVGGAGPYEGDAWSFTTSDHVVVEDFEAYTDDEGGQIYKAWVDGYEDPANGSQVGHLTSPFAERTIVHDGRQAMPLFYSNTNGATFSEGTYTFDTPQDWTRAGIATLALWFRGAAGNAGQLYVKINNTKVPYDGTAGTLALAGWQPWSIDLTALSANLKSVRTLTIGVEGNGASGTLYFDDVALYRSAFEPVLEWKVTSSTDDNEEFANGGAMAGADSSDLELGYEGDLDPTNLQIVGCRWVGIAVPKGATITEAWVQFSADDVDNAYHTPAVSVIIEGELSAGPLTFSNTGGELSSRKKTTANVVWNIPTWTTVHAKGPDERTPDISKIIQEIVNQPDWAGEAIVLTFRDNPAKPSQGCREAEAFDGGADEAPALHIRYE